MEEILLKMLMLSILPRYELKFYGGGKNNEMLISFFAVSFSLCALNFFLYGNSRGENFRRGERAVRQEFMHKTFPFSYVFSVELCSFVSFCHLVSMHVFLIIARLHIRSMHASFPLSLDVDPVDRLYTKRHIL